MASVPGTKLDFAWLLLVDFDYRCIPVATLMANAIMMEVSVIDRYQRMAIRYDGHNIL